LHGKTIVRFLLQPLRVNRAAIVRDEDDALQLVHLHQESQLFTSSLAHSLGLFIPGSKARRPASKGQAVIARDLQMLVAELVKGFAPSAVTAIDGNRPDPFRVPSLH